MRGAGGGFVLLFCRGVALGLRLLEERGLRAVGGLETVAEGGGGEEEVVVGGRVVGVGVAVGEEGGGDVEGEERVGEFEGGGERVGCVWDGRGTGFGSREP